MFYHPSTLHSLFFCLTQAIMTWAIYSEIKTGSQILDHSLLKIFVILAIISCILFILCSRIDPGYLQSQTTEELVEQPIQSLQKTTHENDDDDENYESVNISEQCLVCRIPKAIRQKHCKKCQKCVSTYDHHCDFMNVCIGEYNRPYFYIFLIGFSIQLVFVLVKLVIHSIFIEQCFLAANLSSIVLILLGMALVLFCFHTYLMLKNITTWQFLVGPEKIWYIDKLEKITQKKQQDFSVFNKGFFVNLRVYWGSLCRKRRISWEKWLIEHK